MKFKYKIIKVKMMMDLKVLTFNKITKMIKYLKKIYKKWYLKVILKTIL